MIEYAFMSSIRDNRCENFPIARWFHQKNDLLTARLSTKFALASANSSDPGRPKC
jgi:hypothetical protein